MEVHGTLSFGVTAAGAKASVLIGNECWEANYPTLMDAVAAAFINDLLNSDEACEAVAVEHHMIPWVKPVTIAILKLYLMGFALQKPTQQVA